MRVQAEAAKARVAKSDGVSTADSTTGGDVPTIEGAPVPALADGDAVEAIGDAPITDAELAAPLPPLDSFNIVPVEFAEPEDAGDNRAVPYSVQVTGLASADDSTDVDLADLFGGLSALYDGDGKADNIAMVRARLSADADLMQRILASEGYYDGVVKRGSIAVIAATAMRRAVIRRKAPTQDGSRSPPSST